MSWSKHTITHTLDLGVAGECDCDISFNYLPGNPGRISGPPEHCYPPEPAEVEIISVVYRGVYLTPVCDWSFLEEWILENYEEDDIY